MGLQRRTIQKLLREDFLGAKPIIVAAPEREKLVADIKEKLERIHDLDTKNYSYIREEEKPRVLYSFTIVDPEPYYYHGGRTTFRLITDDLGRLIHQRGSRRRLRARERPGRSRPVCRSLQ